MIIGLQSYRSAFIQQIFQIEISDECIVIDRVVSISEAPVENQSISEKSPFSLRKFGEIFQFSLNCPRMLPN